MSNNKNILMNAKNYQIKKYKEHFSEFDNKFDNKSDMISINSSQPMTIDDNANMILQPENSRGLYGKKIYDPTKDNQDNKEDNQYKGPHKKVNPEKEKAKQDFLSKVIDMKSIAECEKDLGKNKNIYQDLLKCGLQNLPSECSSVMTNYFSNVQNNYDKLQKGDKVELVSPDMWNNWDKCKTQIPNTIGKCASLLPKSCVSSANFGISGFFNNKDLLIKAL